MPVVHRTFTIANGASLSDSQQIDEAMLVGVKLPASWTAANLTLQAAGEDAESTFCNVYEQDGTELKIIAAASVYVALQPIKFAGMKHVKIRSGTAATPVNQGGARTIVAYLMTEG